MKLNELKLTNPYLELPDECYEKVAPTPLVDPYLIHANPDVAKILDIDEEELQSDAFVKFKTVSIDQRAQNLLQCVMPGISSGNLSPGLEMAEPSISGPLTSITCS